MKSIICFPDGDFEKGLPIMDSDEEGYPSTMATWDTKEEAKQFIFGHPLSASSTILIIDFEEDEMIWL
jgi:hypothetical protein